MSIRDRLLELQRKLLGIEEEARTARAGLHDLAVILGCKDEDEDDPPRRKKPPKYEEDDEDDSEDNDDGEVGDEEIQKGWVIVRPNPPMVKGMTSYYTDKGWGRLQLAAVYETKKAAERKRKLLQEMLDQQYPNDRNDPELRFKLHVAKYEDQR